MNFFKNVLSSFVAICIAVVVFVLIGVGIALSMSKNATKNIEENAVLEINLAGVLKDYMPNAVNPISDVLGFEEKELGFNNICNAIEAASYDDKIKGISLKNIPENIGWAQITTLRKILTDFKANGKFIYAFDDVYSQKKYYLNSVADSLFVSPLGRVELKGLHSEVMFYKSFQKKYGVKLEVIRHGKYKSAVEPFIADEMSASNKKQIAELIGGLWNNIQNAIFSSRKINVEEAVLNLYGRSTITALKNGLVDGVIYVDTYLEKIKTRLRTKKLNTVLLTDYMAQIKTSNSSDKKPNLAVIYAQGNIIYGKGDIDVIGHEKMVKTIDEAAQDDEVKAIVLRINSPGGSALASDLIWRAVEKAKQKKPVVVSMGNLAASGGYYIAAPAHRIFAEPTTITGSIGVFGVLPNASVLADKVGIHSEVVSTHNNDVYYSVVQPLNKGFEKIIKSSIEEIYDVFLDRVAQGRSMTKTAVNEVAQGRVWTGKKALEMGLVDELGSLNDAIVYAANQAGLKNYVLKELPKYTLNLQDMVNPASFIKSSLNNTVVNYIGLNNIANIKQVFTTKGVQVRVPFEMSIQ